MRVLISSVVHNVIAEFYEITLQRHVALDETIAVKKIDRLYEAMESLGQYARIHPKACYTANI